MCARLTLSKVRQSAQYLLNYTVRERLMDLPGKNLVNKIYSEECAKWPQMVRKKVGQGKKLFEV